MFCGTVYLTFTDGIFDGDQNDDSPSKLVFYNRVVLVEFCLDFTDIHKNTNPKNPMIPTY